MFRASRLSYHLDIVIVESMSEKCNSSQRTEASKFIKFMNPPPETEDQDIAMEPTASEAVLEEIKVFRVTR